MVSDYLQLVSMKEIQFQIQRPTLTSAAMQHNRHIRTYLYCFRIIQLITVSLACILTKRSKLLDWLILSSYKNELYFSKILYQNRIDSSRKNSENFISLGDLVKSQLSYDFLIHSNPKDQEVYQNWIFMIKFELNRILQQFLHLLHNLLFGCFDVLFAVYTWRLFEFSLNKLKVQISGMLQFF